MNERRTIVALLCAIAVLLTLNLMRPVGADVHAGGVSDGEPYVVKRLAFSHDLYYRVWSDGQADYLNRAVDTCEWVFQAVVAEPVAHPAPVVDANLAEDARAIIMEFADGRVDHVALREDFLRCTIAGEGSDPYCMGDTDRSGVTDFADLLTVLEDWGPCEPGGTP